MQNDNNQVKWLLNRIDESLSDIGKKKIFFQNRASIIKMLAIALSAGLTICLGLRLPEYELELRMAAFLMGGIVTFLNALEPFFNYRSLWIEHEEAQYKLHRLKDQIDFYMAGDLMTSIEPDQMDKFYANYNEIWDSLSNNWLKFRKIAYRG
jgi:hypothetical protein